ncbi:MAG: glycosyltransferase family 39 protein [Sedimentisphaerales bacterium]|nr:glycosyltransferase family 39 protein [Sedimentisphaerales bacterium]
MLSGRGISSYEISGTISRYPVRVTLFIILLVAGFLRLVKFGQSPPGLNQDEAVNGWNAYCLLKTGKDQHGVSWPVYYIQGLGGNGSTLYMYLTIPFQAIGGLNITTTRLPGAIGGIFTVLIIYLTGKRLFDKETGLLASLLLTLNPWHLQQSRWGHEASICALLGIAPLAMLLWAGLPISGAKTNGPRPVLAGLAGIISGICCYGYQSVRIFVPFFLMVVVLLMMPEWRRSIKTRKGFWAIAAFMFGFAMMFGPLFWQHVFHPEGISRNAIAQNKVGYFLADAAPLTAVKNIFIRYIRHFGPDFLFIHGDYLPLQSPPGIGVFHWYMLPLMVLGLIVILKTFRSASVRLALAFVIAYPIGDSLYQMVGMHALRSAPGTCGLILLAALGGVETARWLWRRRREAGLVAVSAFFTSVIILNIQHFYRFYFLFNVHPSIYNLFNKDLVEACEWLKPRLGEYDGVFFTTNNFNMPYIITLTAIGYEPNKWFNEPQEFTTSDIWDYYTRYGKMHFIYKNSYVSSLISLQQSNPASRILFIIRPGEFNLGEPIHRIIRTDGKEVLWICEPPKIGENSQQRRPEQ